MEIFGIVIGISGFAFTVFTYFKPRSIKKNPPEFLKPNKDKDILENILSAKKITVGFFHYPPFIIHLSLKENLSMALLKLVAYMAI